MSEAKEGIVKDTPKTAYCCGLKPNRTFYQTSFRDDEGKWQFKCRKNCGNVVWHENQYHGTSKSEVEATLKWNELVTKVESQ